MKNCYFRLNWIIGKSLLEIIDKDKKNYETTLTANKNYKKLINQAKKHKVKNIIIINKNSFRKACNYNKTNKIKIFNSFNKLNLIFKKINTLWLNSGIRWIETYY